MPDVTPPPSLRSHTVVLAGKVVLRDVSFAPAMGTLTVLCGPNGAGKTTLLRALAGLLPGDERYRRGSRCAGPAFH